MIVDEKHQTIYMGEQWDSIRFSMAPKEGDIGSQPVIEEENLDASPAPTVLQAQPFDYGGTVTSPVPTGLQAKPSTASDVDASPRANSSELHTIRDSMLSMLSNRADTQSDVGRAAVPPRRVRSVISPQVKRLTTQTDMTDFTDIE
jgi:hypothetical protein